VFFDLPGRISRPFFFRRATITMKQRFDGYILRGMDRDEFEDNGVDYRYFLLIRFDIDVIYCGMVGFGRMICAIEIIVIALTPSIWRSPRL
jgi:hypothetical protein